MISVSKTAMHSPAQLYATAFYLAFPLLNIHSKASLQGYFSKPQLTPVVTALH